MRRKFKKRKQFVFSHEQAYFDFVLKKSLEMSSALGYQLTVSELVRRAMEHYLPMPETMDMFGEVDMSKIDYQRR